eukprot:TRINITY_DN108046_c0_g1_i1.p1 TRINITY_DN108046_c0_g1~~TRINITY_DN108046_c0_g1_i1.p1  ORF type:complete len:232 (+),score=44.42 TRINITY_DN108046_c0_g1_i1:43-738(+)
MPRLLLAVLIASIANVSGYREISQGTELDDAAEAHKQREESGHGETSRPGTSALGNISEQGEQREGNDSKTPSGNGSEQEHVDAATESDDKSSSGRVSENRTGDAVADGRVVDALVNADSFHDATVCSEEVKTCRHGIDPREEGSQSYFVSCAGAFVELNLGKCCSLGDQCNFDVKSLQGSRRRADGICTTSGRGVCRVKPMWLGIVIGVLMCLLGSCCFFCYFSSYQRKP